MGASEPQAGTPCLSLQDLMGTDQCTGTRLGTHQTDQPPYWSFPLQRPGPPGLPHQSDLCACSFSAPRVPPSFEQADLGTSSTVLGCTPGFVWNVSFLVWNLDPKTRVFKGSGNKGRCSEDFMGHMMLKD